MRALKPTTILLCAGLSVLAGAQAQEARIDVQADQAAGRVSRLLTGACIEDVNHEIYGGIYSQMVFGESFQEPSPPPAIDGFKAHGGHWKAANGVLSVNGADGPKLVSDHRPFKDGAAGVELLFADRKGDNAGLVVRVSNAGVGADRFTGYEVAVDAGRQKLRLARHRNNYELIKDESCAVPVGRWFALEARFAGSVLEILVDGKTVLRHDDEGNALPAGAVGLRAWNRDVSFRKLWANAAGRVEPLAFNTSKDFPEISAMWRAVQRGSASGRFAIATDKPFAGTQSQQIRFESGEGEWGLENQGLNRWGMSFVADKPYEGCVWVRAEQPTTLVAALEDRGGSRRYAETSMAVASGDWQQLDFKLTPNASDAAGRFTLFLRQPGSLTLGYAFLQPGDWGRFKGLPVRRDVAEALVAQGITVLRYGGSMVNHSEYRWKKMIGPRHRRPPHRGTWYAHSSNGWGILDFMDFCEAAGFEYIPDFFLGETPQDMADFVEYAKGGPDTEWGRRRVADGHPQPYRLPYLQLGNEERVDEKYAATFESLARAIWAKDPDLTLVVGDFCYGERIEDPFKFGKACAGITSLAGQQRILRLAKENNREVWFDLHVGTDGPRPDSSFDGMLSFVDALAKIADGARHRVVVFEFNAGNPTHRRALGNALAIHAIERDGRIPIATSANCLQPDGQNDNGWDQGLLFLNPSQVWLQPPGYVTQILSQNYLPILVKCQVTGAGGALDANAKISDDGKTLVLQVVNPTANALSAQLRVSGFTPGVSMAQVTELAAPLTAKNTAAKQDAVVPQRSSWNHGLKEGPVSRAFPPYSLTVLRFQ